MLVICTNRLEYYLVLIMVWLGCPGVGHQDSG